MPGSRDSGFRDRGPTFTLCPYNELTIIPYFGKCECDIYIFICDIFNMLQKHDNNVFKEC